MATPRQPRKDAGAARRPVAPADCGQGLDPATALRIDVAVLRARCAEQGEEIRRLREDIAKFAGMVAGMQEALRRQGQSQAAATTTSKAR